MTEIFGAGGKGGGSASEAPDSLDSTAYARIVDVLSEGEIEGFATPSKLGLTRGTTEYANASMKDVFYNDTRLLRVAASNSSPAPEDFNFKGVQLWTRFGTQSQTFVDNDFNAIEDEIAVGTTVEKDVPLTRTIDDENTDAVRVTITLPALQRVQNDGDIVGTSVRLQIQVQYNGGGFQIVVDDTVSGRTGDQYQKDYLIYLNKIFPVDIRVVRITDDSTSVRLQNSFSWFSYTEIVYQKLTYPNTAFVASRIDASQFSSIPRRSYRIRGLKVKIPSNATVDITNGRLIYTGAWNGQFAAAQWTTCPAWILHDLLTSTRYGFGDHIKPEMLDKSAFYSASKYANELVTTGFDTPQCEPRFSCNVNIQSQVDAYKLITDLASVFRGMTYWAAGSLTVTQDRPTDSVASLFTLANVEEPGFSYETSSLKARATAVAVSWFNLERQDVDVELVEDPEAIAKYGIVQKQVEAFACTSRAQARRVGEWMLFSDTYENEIVTFKTGFDTGSVVRPGSVIEIADLVRIGARKAGRVRSATYTTVTIDNADGISSGTTIAVALPDSRVEVRSISSVVGNVVTVASPFSLIPQNGAVWMTGLPLYGRGGGDCPSVCNLYLQPEVTGPIVDTVESDTFSPVTGTLTASGGTGGILTYSIVGSSAGSYGTLTVDANGNYTYTPNSSTINGLPAGRHTDIFTVQVTNGSQTTTSTLTVEIDGVNDAPTQFGSQNVVLDSPSTVEITVVRMPAASIMAYYCPRGGAQIPFGGWNEVAGFTSVYTGYGVRSYKLRPGTWSYTVDCGSGPTETTGPFGAEMYSDTGFSSWVAGSLGNVATVQYGGIYSDEYQFNQIKITQVKINGVIQPIT